MTAKWLKWLAAGMAMLAFAGILAFWLLPPKGHIPVLMYHFVVPKQQVGSTSLDVSQEVFAKQMRFLRAFGFRPISLDEFYAIKQGQAEARGKEIVITFDDGNKSYAEYALPVLVRYGVPSANFVVWDNVTRKLHGSMDVETTREVARNPLVTLGAHSLTHAILPDQSEEQIRQEVFESKKKLEALLNRSVHYFSYPAGAFNDEAVEMVEAAGYRLAFTTSRKHILKGRRQTHYTITRTKVGRQDGLLEFWFKTSGLASFFERLKYLF